MNNFIVFDFETDGTDSATCNPTQLACLTIDPYNLNIIENSFFCSDIKPYEIDDPQYFTDERMDAIKWHASNKKCTTQEIIEQWKNAPPEKTVWTNLVQHVNKCNPKNSQWTAPVPCGANIKNFDLVIAARLNERYKVNKLFNYEIVDIRDLAFLSLMWDRSLTKRTMDSLRKYYGIPATNSHDALQDCKDEAIIITRYLKFFKATFNRIKYKGCMKPE